MVTARGLAAAGRASIPPWCRVINEPLLGSTGAPGPGWAPRGCSSPAGLWTLLVLPCSPPGVMGSAAPQSPWCGLLWDVSCEGWGSQAWDIPLSPALMVPDQSWGRGLHPDTWPCSSALLLILKQVWHLLWCRDGPELWGYMVASTGPQGSPIWWMQVTSHCFGECHSQPHLDTRPWPHGCLSPSHPAASQG